MSSVNLPPNPDFDSPSPEEKEEYIWRFKLLKKLHPSHNIQDYNEGDDLQLMKTAYDQTIHEIYNETRPLEMEEVAELSDPRFEILSQLQQTVYTTTGTYLDFYDLTVEFQETFNRNFDQFLHLAKIEVLRRVAGNPNARDGELARIVRLFNDTSLTSVLTEFYNGKGMRLCNLFLISILKKDWASASQLIDLGADFWSVTPWKSAPWMIVAMFTRSDPTLLYKMFLWGAQLEPEGLDVNEYKVQEYAREAYTNLKVIEQLVRQKI
jgi:hypothetical protein